VREDCGIEGVRLGREQQRVGSRAQDNRRPSGGSRYDQEKEAVVSLTIWH
jgi:hypothetical protein